MTPRNPSEKPTLEDLIRIKRAERPPAEFWQRFEEELRAKQLAAIVERRPWWQSLTGLLSARRATIAGFGAVAALAALAYLRLPSNQTLAVAQIVIPEVSGPAQAVASTPVASEKPAVQPVAVVAAVPPTPSSGEAVIADNSGKLEDQHQDATVASLVVNPVLVTFSEIQVPPPRSAMEMSAPAAPLAFASSIRTERGSSEPLASIPSPQDQRAARFASFTEVAMLAGPDMAASPRSRSTPRDSDLREREIRRLSAKANMLGLNF
jgi:hypothetical protein